MEIPARYFFSFWALISLVFLHLGFNAFDETGLSNSVTPIVMSFFRYSLAISTYHSSNYALLFDSNLKLDIGIVLSLWAPVNLLIICGVLIRLVIECFVDLMSDDRYSLIFITSCSLAGLFPIYYYIFLPIFFREYQSIGRNAIGIYICYVNGQLLLTIPEEFYFPVLVLFIAAFTSAYWAVLSGLEPLTSVSLDPSYERFRYLLPLAVRSKKFLSSFMGKFIGYAVGIMGTILFQNFFKLTTFNHVEAFMYFAVSWLANITLVRASWDFGVFNFLLWNVIVGCTVSQFELQGTTWLAYGVCLLLFGLRLGLEALTFVKESTKEEEEKVVLW